MGEAGVWNTANLGATSETELGTSRKWDRLKGGVSTATNDNLPSQSEFNKLLSTCDSEFVENYKESGVNGLLFTAENGNKLFFPATKSDGMTGEYPTKTKNTSAVETTKIYFLTFDATTKTVKQKTFTNGLDLNQFYLREMVRE